MDVFAWKPADMPGVPQNLIEHSLNVNSKAKPIKQKLQQFARDKKEVIHGHDSSLHHHPLALNTDGEPYAAETPS